MHGTMCHVMLIHLNQVYMRQSVTTNKVHSMSLGIPRHAWRTSTTNAHRLKVYFAFQHQRSAVQCSLKATQATALRSLAPHCPQCPQHGPRSLLPSPSACLLHYLKHSLVFICRAGDVASSSTFPSRAVYIREPIWLYKTRQQKGGGPEPERGETWKPFYGAANCALDNPVHCT